jgi:hypothetical protein
MEVNLYCPDPSVHPIVAPRETRAHQLTAAVIEGPDALRITLHLRHFFPTASFNLANFG